MHSPVLFLAILALFLGLVVWLRMSQGRWMAHHPADASDVLGPDIVSELRGTRTVYRLSGCPNFVVMRQGEKVVCMRGHLLAAIRYDVLDGDTLSADLFKPVCPEFAVTDVDPLTGTGGDLPPCPVCGASWAWAQGWAIHILLERGWVEREPSAELYNEMLGGEHAE